MKQLSNDYSVQSEPRRDGILESASKRVRMIFSVMASPNRIDILRILNSKGPLTYSELKSLAGFKSKKESGKFAYHLRKLLRQSLVALNKGERRYTITNLGKLVLSLARQIEERSIIESGKMYVRTSKQSIEEFNSHKIIQSLVREANMPLEQAHKITEEVENKVYKFQTAYLTSSLIRETVNSVLIEHGHEEYRNKLARLGLPTSDIFEMLNNIDKIGNGIDSVISKVAQSMLSEHLIINTLPKDIADMHLAGEINISNSGIWGLVPDTVFVNIDHLAESGIDLKGKFLNVSRLTSINNIDELATALPLLISLLSREASTEIVLDGITSLLNRIGDSREVAALLTRALMESSAAPMYSSDSIFGLPITTITLDIEDQSNSKLINEILDSYNNYLNFTSVPRIGIALKFGGKDILRDYSEKVVSIIRTGGLVSMARNKSRSLNGIHKLISNKVSSGTVATLQSLSINLPRLAYQSNKDETYFRARLALMIKPALSAMSIRKKALTDLIRKGMLPTLSSSTQFTQLGTHTTVINLTGAKESVNDILGHEINNGGIEILQKVLKTAVDVATDQGRQMGEDHVGIAMINDDSARRFASLDSDKYGKISLMSSQQGSLAYSQGLTVYGKELVSPNDSKSRLIVDRSNSIDNLLNGGLAVNLDMNDLSSNIEMKNAIESASELQFFRPVIKHMVCSTCGKRAGKDVTGKCEFCTSPYLLPFSI
ncbi:MAG: anaerobic ribonucleoside-triphosphate reductase [Nitrososphaeraceae archaeon]|jgi:anaerobic ribonucleoside-triphosphate reductase/predicted transcriptional regulator